MKRLSNPIKTSLVLITLIIVAFIALGFYKYYSITKVDWSKTKDVVDVLKNIATLIAVAAGGIWAYFNFFKGRTYRPRLELKVSGKLLSQNGANYLVVTAQLKNVGLSDVKIDQQGSALRLFAYEVGERTSKARSVEKSRLITLPVFEAHGWVEPGELIEEQRLVAIPDLAFIALQITFRLVSNKIDWNSVAIIEPPQPTLSPANQAQLDERTPTPFETEKVDLSKSKKPTDEIGRDTANLANIMRQKEEDAEESCLIEAEKKSVEMVEVEKAGAAQEYSGELQSRQGSAHEDGGGT